MVVLELRSVTVYFGTSYVAAYRKSVFCNHRVAGKYSFIIGCACLTSYGSEFPLWIYWSRRIGLPRCADSDEKRFVYRRFCPHKNCIGANCIVQWGISPIIMEKETQAKKGVVYGPDCDGRCVGSAIGDFVRLY